MKWYSQMKENQIEQIKSDKNFNCDLSNHFLWTNFQQPKKQCQWIATKIIHLNVSDENLQFILQLIGESVVSFDSKREIKLFVFMLVLFSFYFCWYSFAPLETITVTWFHNFPRTKNE